jgi:hypothetical protein
LKKIEERLAADNVGRSRGSKPVVNRVTCVSARHSESLDGDLGVFLERNFNLGHLGFCFRNPGNILFGCGPETDLDLARELDFEPSELAWNQRARLEVN